MNLENYFDTFLISMACLAILVFIALFYVRAGYGKFYNKSWGPTIGNRIGWVVMEAPVFILMSIFWLTSDRTFSLPHIILFAFFQVHYFQRSFIFPLLIRGKGVMPLSVILMGLIFNSLNALMQGGWIFYISDFSYYTTEWFTTPPFLFGALTFIFGMVINIHSDYIIRHLRKPGETRHYLPQKGMFKYVTSANYFGEFLEWTGYALLTWSWSGAVFALWTFANLAPRANAIRESYKQQFPEAFKHKNIKRIIPFIY